MTLLIQTGNSDRFVFYLTPTISLRVRVRVMIRVRVSDRFMVRFMVRVRVSMDAYQNKHSQQVDI